DCAIDVSWFLQVFRSSFFYSRIHVLLFVLLNSYVDPVYKDYGKVARCNKVARCSAWVHDQQCHQIYGPTKNRQAETFLQLLCHFCYSSFTCTVWSELENRGSSCKY
ncbi:unnamed protein product, partial [Brassica oleracea]